MVKVLVVDDSAFMRAMLKDILTQNNHEVVGEAANGNEAIQLYETLSPDIVTMDITMPQCDGISALKQIMSKNPDARVIMCSAMGQQAKVIESVQAGAKDFIVKPFNPNKVIESVGKNAK